MYWYISHLGGLYCTESEVDIEDLYCEECGDWDEYLGYFETEEEAEKAYSEYFMFDDEDEDETI